MNKAISKIPHHLLKYVVEQNYDMYTSEDQEVWRFVMRQLQSFLSTAAHESYLSGLKQTGISTDEIPKISVMDEKLTQFGWRAVPVSGFIPPAAFMEFQAHSILPIACDMRTLDHILYTPAPDIVHEAAGHAPILVDPDFSNYLKNYAEIADKAILSHEDLNLYKAIRSLSDIKEAPSSSAEDIHRAELELKNAIQNMTYVSEAQLLGRMNWWTAEYGLIGNLKNAKIFGAGLLSSIGESRTALKRPKLIPLSIDCLNFSYDITEPQPQLFVAEDFKSLNLVLNELSEKMAFKIGGQESLKKAVQAKTVCTVILKNGPSYSGRLQEFDKNHLFFKGPIQIKDSHGIQLLQTTDYVVNLDSNTKIQSVHGGPIESSTFPDDEDFALARVPSKKRNLYDLEKFKLYSQIRSLRQNFSHQEFLKIKTEYLQNYKKEWLMGLGLIEIAAQQVHLNPQLMELMNHYSLRSETETLSSASSKTKSESEKLCIDLGLALLKSEGLLL